MIPDTLPTAVALIVKIFFLLGLFVYMIFALVVVRQERLMAGVLEENFEPVLRVLTYLHLALSIASIVFAFIIL